MRAVAFLSFQHLLHLLRVRQFGLVNRSHVKPQSTFLSERLVTLLTFVRPHTCVRFHMGSQVTSPGKRPLTVLNMTLIRFDFAMNSHMLLQIHISSKRLAAYMTYVWFRVRVKIDMMLQFCFEMKSHSALLTFKSLFIRVTRAYMYIASTRCSKCFSALTANIRLLSTVNAHMCLHGKLLGESSPADAAFMLVAITCTTQHHTKGEGDNNRGHPHHANKRSYDWR